MCCLPWWEAESVLAYGTVTDLLDDVDAEYWLACPRSSESPSIDSAARRQRWTLTDQQVVAAALMTIVATLASQAPVLIAIDDVQWLDPSTGRRVVRGPTAEGRVCLIGTARRSQPRKRAVLAATRHTRWDRQNKSAR